MENITDYKKELKALIDLVINESASDLHLSSDNYPTIRVNSVLIPLLKRRRLLGEDTLGFISELLTQEQKQNFLLNKENVKGKPYLRVFYKNKRLYFEIFYKYK